MLTVKNLIGVHPPSRTRWNKFLKELEGQIIENKEIIMLERMGFPHNWKECLNL